MKYLQYVIMLILLGLGIFVGYKIHKPKQNISDCSKVISHLQTKSDSLYKMINILQDSLSKKIQYDTVFISKKYIKEINKIKSLPIDSALLFFTTETSFMEGY
jgi:hypothetical protein